MLAETAALCGAFLVSAWVLGSGAGVIAAGCAGALGGVAYVEPQNGGEFALAVASGAVGFCVAFYLYARLLCFFRDMARSFSGPAQWPWAAFESLAVLALPMAAGYALGVAVEGEFPEVVRGLPSPYGVWAVRAVPAALMGLAAFRLQRRSVLAD